VCIRAARSFGERMLREGLATRHPPSLASQARGLAAFESRINWLGSNLNGALPPLRARLLHPLCWYLTCLRIEKLSRFMHGSRRGI